MIISSATDFRSAARRRLPPFLFHYLDGGSYAEHTLRCNTSDLANLALRQRILRNVADIDTSVELFGEDEIEMWMTAEWPQVQALQRPLADDVLIALPKEAPDEPQGRLL